MNAKLILILALTASVALNAFLFARKPAADSAPIPVSKATKEKSAVQPDSSEPAKILVVTNKSGQPIDWRHVESADYKQYIANLRAIGCPEDTIRDIIAADVKKLFEDRKRSLGGASTNKFEFWKSGMQMFAKAFDEDKIKQQQDLAKEKRALLTELLGAAPDEKPDIGAAMGGANILEQMLDFLPTSKQTTVLEVIEKYQAKMMKNMGNAGFDADTMKDISKVQREMEAELSKTLSPKELEDFNLRMSNTANIMRFSLASFEPNEQEFREIFKQKKTFDDEFGFAGIPPTDKAEKEKYDVAKKEMDAQLKQALGDRYADYQRSQDYAYQSLYSVAQRNGVPKESIVQVYDMKKAAEQQAKNVRNDKSLSTEQRDQALQAIRAETERSAKEALGEKAFQSYQKQPGGNWLKNLSPDRK